MWQKFSTRPAAPSRRERLNRVLDEAGFDAFVEGLWAVEGLSSERGIAWRVADSLSLRSFLDLEVTEMAPDHSTLSRTRRLIDVETHVAVFDLQRLVDDALLRAGRRSAASADGGGHPIGFSTGSPNILANSAGTNSRKRSTACLRGASILAARFRMSTICRCSSSGGRGIKSDFKSFCPIACKGTALGLRDKMGFTVLDRPVHEVAQHGLVAV